MFNYKYIFGCLAAVVVGLIIIVVAGNAAPSGDLTVNYGALPHNAHNAYIELYNNNIELFQESYRGGLKEIVPSAIVDAQVKLYDLDRKFNSRQEVVSYLQEVSGEFPFESHKRNASNYDWKRISKDIKVSKEGVTQIYSIRYSNLTPTCEDYEVFISSDGYLMDFRYDKQL